MCVEINLSDGKYKVFVDGQTIKLITDMMKINKEVTFNFDVKDATPESYLDALGHVMITDEKGETLAKSCTSRCMTSICNTAIRNRLAERYVIRCEDGNVLRHHEGIV